MLHIISTSVMCNFYVTLMFYYNNLRARVGIERLAAKRYTVKQTGHVSIVSLVVRNEHAPEY